MTRSGQRPAGSVSPLLRASTTASRAPGRVLRWTYRRSYGSLPFGVGSGFRSSSVVDPVGNGRRWSRRTRPARRRSGCPTPPGTSPARPRRANRSPPPRPARRRPAARPPRATARGGRPGGGRGGAARSSRARAPASTAVRRRRVSRRGSPATRGSADRAPWCGCSWSRGRAPRGRAAQECSSADRAADRVPPAARDADHAGKPRHDLGHVVPSLWTSLLTKARPQDRPRRQTKIIADGPSSGWSHRSFSELL